jgi:hypothetical protein
MRTKGRAALALVGILAVGAGLPSQRALAQQIEAQAPADPAGTQRVGRIGTSGTGATLAPVLNLNLDCRA